ncbi:dihydrofolate reductase [Glutamicibacter protophormiae]|uniref:dihydrofolate reductase n=1 Tax=Glutamicibacter protophormiae TaxID=37930 RepID=UPI00195C0D8F|nr:dihydrofolate reductase [Glutamicibacter protophormiae]QRQ77694.1 dihydrofolate reductase [Glutamicibacter protophormiae]
MTNTTRLRDERRPFIGAIWAEDKNRIIGALGTMPWHVPEDLAYFKNVTAGHPVIMGRTTWDSFPTKFRPLPGRTNIVLSTNAEIREQLRESGAFPASSLDEALELAGQSNGSDQIWIIGGGKVYAEALGYLDEARISKFDLEREGDTFAPQLGSDFRLAESDPAPVDNQDRWHVSKHEGIQYRFETWIREKD